MKRCANGAENDGFLVMDLLTLILLSVGLAMDCLAVSLAKGLASRRNTQWGWALLMAVLFGLFQGGMPLAGYFAGVHWTAFFSRWSHWIALLLLGFIGGRMVVEGLRPAAGDVKQASAVFTLPGLLLLAVATSIDALATGVLFIPCADRLCTGVLIIAFGSFVFSLAGYAAGSLLGRRFRLNAGLLGGLILVGIGLKIFLEH